MTDAKHAARHRAKQRKLTNRFAGMALAYALQTFQTLYPPYSPARGMAEYVRLNWDRYQYVD